MIIYLVFLPLWLRAVTLLCILYVQGKHMEWFVSVILHLIQVRTLGDPPQKTYPLHPCLLLNPGKSLTPVPLLGEVPEVTQLPWVKLLFQDL